MTKLYCLLLALVLAAPLGGRAQGVDSLHQQLDYAFAPLDKSQVPTRLLAEYGTPLVKLPPYNGMLGPHNIVCPSASINHSWPESPRYFAALSVLH